MVKVPSNAKRVFKGVVHEVYQWDQEMFDGSVEVFEMIKRRGGSAIICVTDDCRIVVLNEEQPFRGEFLSIPAGGLDEGEKSDFLALAKRELLEETGFEAGIWEKFIFSNGFSKLDMPEYIYIAKNCKKVADLNLDVGEKIFVDFYEFEDFLNLCRDSSFRCVSALRYFMYECLLDEGKKEEFRRKLFD